MRVYRASSLGYSLCQLVCPHLGYEPAAAPEWLQARYDEGTALEPLVLAELERLGWTIVSTQPEINSEGDNQIEALMEVIPGEVQVRGHLDAIGIEPPNLPTRVVEVKSMAEKSFKECCRLGWQTPGLIQKYKWQLSCYMLATGLGGVLVVCSKGADGINNLLYLYADEPFYTISDIANKLSLAEARIEDGTIPSGCTDYPCQFYYLHEEKDAKEVVEADSELEAILSAWHEADRNAKTYEGEKKALREEIIKLIGDGGNAAPIIKSSSGVKVETYWQEGSEYVTKRLPKWITKVSGPRNG